MNAKKIICGITVLLIVLGGTACDAINLPQMINLPDLPKIDLGLGLGATKGVTGSGDVVKETRTLRDIQEVILSGSGNLNIIQGNNEGLEIEAEDNLIQYFNIAVNQGKLTIDTGSGSTILPTEPINFYLNVKNLNTISLEGSGDIQSDSLRGNQVTINLNGSGNIKIPKFRSQTLTVNIPGSGDVRLGGKVNQENINITGSGNYFTKGLASTGARIVVGGSGAVEVFATNKLEVNIKGSGVVRYLGNPQLTKYISGSGGVQKIQP